MNNDIIKRQLRNKIQEICNFQIDSSDELESLIKLLNEATKSAIILEFSSKFGLTTFKSPSQEDFKNTIQKNDINKQDEKEAFSDHNESLNKFSENTNKQLLSEKIATKISTPLADKLQTNPIDNLYKFLSLNERHFYANELFNQNIDEFLSTLKKIDALSIKSEAFLIIKQFKNKYNWQKDNKTVKEFVKLLERRFEI